MKRFNLDEYLDNPNRKVVTRNGKSVRIKCTDRKCVDYPIIALIDLNEIEDFYAFSRDGECWIGEETKYDLFFAPEKKVGWVNVYKNAYGAYVLGEIFIGKEHEEVTTGLTYITTAKIEWEE